MGGGDLAGLALDAVAEEDAVMAGGPHGGLGGAERVGRAGDETERGAGRTRGLPVSAIRCRDRQAPGVTGSAKASRNRAATALASASVVGSGTVGPDPMTAGSSPGTSEIPSVTTGAG